MEPILLIIAIILVITIVKNTVFVPFGYWLVSKQRKIPFIRPTSHTVLESGKHVFFPFMSCPERHKDGSVLLIPKSQHHCERNPTTQILKTQDDISIRISYRYVFCISNFETASKLILGTNDNTGTIESWSTIDGILEQLVLEPIVKNRVSINRFQKPLEKELVNLIQSEAKVKIQSLKILAGFEIKRFSIDEIAFVMSVKEFDELSHR